jgi:hypothetical protein
MSKIAGLPRYLMVFIASIMFLIPLAFGLSLEIGSDVGSSHKEINAKNEQAVANFVKIAADSMSDTINGAGDIKMSFSKTSSDASAEVGFDIKNSEGYSYSYYIDDFSTEVSDTLDVINADNIIAYASAHNSRGDTASASTRVSDEKKRASLQSYSSLAHASETNVWAYQNIGGASGSKIQIDKEAISAEGDSASNSVIVNEGSIDGYSGSAEAFWYQYGTEPNIARSADIDYDIGASGDRIQINDQATTKTGDVTRKETKVNDGSVSGYHIYSSARGYQGDSQGEMALINCIITGMTGTNVKSEDQAANAAGDAISNNLAVIDGSLGYMGYMGYGSLVEAGWYQSDSSEERFVHASNSISNLIGSRIAIDEQVFAAEGDTTSTNIALNGGSIEGYYADASWYQDNQQYRDSYAYQNLLGIYGTKLDLTAQAVNAEGVKEYKSTKIKNPDNIGYENSAEVSLGVPSIYQSQY